MRRELMEKMGVKSVQDLLMFDPEDVVIVDDPNHPLYDHERVALPFDENMVLSMSAVGVRTPVKVRQNGETADGKAIIEVVDGRQRVKACREANRRLLASGGTPLRLPAVMERGDDLAHFVTMVVSNTQRRAPAPVGTAKRISDYMARGYKESDARVLFNMSGLAKQEDA